uniref:K Homology domain-containing protein n=2 Tax=Pygocentrus nattereri TaxID=42514 RepID=A0A3B4DFE9_PYGNA
MQHIPLTSLGQSNPTFPGLDASVATSSHELTIPNDLIGCIIGRQGTKINEIRQMSGAQIKIAGATDGSAVRHVTISGSPASISLAQYLISASLEMAKLSIQAASSSSSGNPVDLSLSFPQSASPASTPSSVAMLAAPPSAINVHSPQAMPTIPSAHYALPVSSLLGMKTVPLLAVHTAASGLTPYTAKIPTSATIKKSERQKFAPY